MEDQGMENTERKINIIDGISKRQLHHANKYPQLNLKESTSLKLYLYLLHASLRIDGFKQHITKNLDNTLKGSEFNQNQGRKTRKCAIYSLGPNFKKRPTKSSLYGTLPYRVGSWTLSHPAGCSFLSPSCFWRVTRSGGPIGQHPPGRVV